MRTGLQYALAMLVLLVVGGATASANVLADEPVTFSVEAAAAGAEPGTPAAFTIKLSAPLDSAASVRFSTAPLEGGDAAAANSDYVPVNGVRVQVPKGHTAAKVEVRVLDDQLDEWLEKFVVTLSDPSEGTQLTSLRSAIGSIQDNDDPPAARVANAPDVTEGNTTAKATFVVSLSKRSGRDVRVAFATRDGTAKAGEDYVARSGVVGIAAGELSAGVSVDVVGDTKKENTESFTLAIAREDETAVMGSPTEGSVKILDDDVAVSPPPPPPAPVAATVSIADVTAEEPSGQPGAATFAVTLAPAVTRAVTVNWATADGTATAGADYTAGNGTVSFAPGETAKTVTVTLLADELAEAAETFSVNLSGPVGATLGDGQAVGTIVEKGTVIEAPPAMSIGDVVARESEGAIFTVELTKAAPTRITATFSTSDGTAREGLDYLGRTSTVEFGPGERTKTIAITIVDDELAEPAETFSVGLGNAVNATIARSRGFATIESSDAVASRQDATPAGVLPVTVTAPAGSGKTAKEVKALVPRMSLWPVRVKVGGLGVARMTAACKAKSPVTCSGRVALETVAKPKFQLAVTSFRVRPGKQASLAFKLGPRGLALVEREGRIRARVVVLVKIGPLLWRVLPGLITLESPTAAARTRP